MELLDLPDDALLAVLGFLPPRQLFACRVACRRLRDLCLHRYLWRHVSLDGGKAGVVLAALALAPCVKSIVCSGPRDVQASRVKTTNCVVTRLKLFVFGGSNRMALAMEMIQRLYALGGLRELDVNIRAIQSTAPLLQQVYYLRDLRKLSLSVNGHVEALAAKCNELETKPSLRELHYDALTGGRAFLELLLRTHASTLQDVSLYFCADEDIPASTLLKIPGLRSLRCFATTSLHHLAVLPSLHTIRLIGLCASGALQFLRDASHLRTVELDACDRHSLPALGSSRSAPLIETLLVRNLVVRYRVFSEKQLLSVLPEFPALKVVDLDGWPSDDFLRGVSPVSAPSLATLAVHCPLQCAHALVHSPAVQSLLLRNPRLHLFVREFLENPCGKKKKSCSWCRKGCHGELLGRKSPMSFSSHVKTAGCPSDCFNVTA
ncbi:F-box/LRR-repeat protein 12-like [Thrips palmi]|uniref:F-box/LRR-repeat protein 12-like n=1 Tax=Thrips palmi TaxID=161013 RepID=A0A6P9AG35_THRPL|nr:F-box/LRR-repeat protein 12-like [Thrips palmi]